MEKTIKEQLKKIVEKRAFRYGWNWADNFFDDENNDPIEYVDDDVDFILESVEICDILGLKYEDKNITQEDLELFGVNYDLIEKAAKKGFRCQTEDIENNLSDMVTIYARHCGTHFEFEFTCEYCGRKRVDEHEKKIECDHYSYEFPGSMYLHAAEDGWFECDEVEKN
jgi:hypothetical protein